MKVLLTGAHGFLGWHTRVRLRALTDHEMIPVCRENWSDLDALTKGVDAIIHCAGINRADPREVESGNVALAAAVADAARASGSCPRIVYANSVHSGGDSPYGRGKELSGASLAAVATEVGGSFTDVRLPNLFGEHGRPSYNSFVATFVAAVADGRRVQISDRQVNLLHVQAAAQSLIDGLSGSPGRIEPVGKSASVQAVYDTLRAFRDLYAMGDIPDLTDQLAIDLFNTLRAALFPSHYPISLIAHADERGRLVETVRSHGGEGQTFVSTTQPGITRGEHFHLSKVERFVVIDGSARISMRRLFTDHVISFVVNGSEPTAVDMPTMWAHNITNVGGNELSTVFWSNKLFDPKVTDTYHERVQSVEA